MEQSVGVRLPSLAPGKVPFFLVPFAFGLFFLVSNRLQPIVLIILRDIRDLHSKVICGTKKADPRIKPGISSEEGKAVRNLGEWAFLRQLLLLFGIISTLIISAGCYYPGYYPDASYYPSDPDILFYPPMITFYLKDRDVPSYYQGPPYYHYYPYDPYYTPAYGNPFYLYYH